MSIQPLFSWLNSLYLQNPILCYAIAGAIIVLVLWKPVKVLKFIVLVLVLALIVYASLYLTKAIDFSIATKKTEMNRTIEELDK